MAQPEPTGKDAGGVAPTAAGTDWPRRLLAQPLEHLYPGYFAQVMATGIISTAFAIAGVRVLSFALLGVALLAFVLLVISFALRLARYAGAFRSDTSDAGRAFGFFTFVAASGVLALRLALAKQAPLFGVFAALCACSWVACSYALVPWVVTRAAKGTVRESVTGAWLIWVVATQSMALVAIRCGGLWPDWSGPLDLAALSLWSAGALLYLLLMSSLLARLLLVPTERPDMSPTYWIAMGATAISVFTGISLLGLVGGPSPLQLIAPTVAGMSFMLWALGTWWVPLLVVLTAWRVSGRHGLRAYDPALWSVVFPLGMYSVATMGLGHRLHVTALVVLGKEESWFALTAWLVTMGLLVRSSIGPRRGSW
ncbi:MAG: tellurite resistance/C4-dicarboxylate transporter family protein [Candidatus Dormibacteria bacterium]